MGWPIGETQGVCGPGFRVDILVDGRSGLVVDQFYEVFVYNFGKVKNLQRRRVTLSMGFGT
jgi:hypothetical protein